MNQDLDDSIVEERVSFQEQETLVVRERGTEPEEPPEIAIVPGLILGSYRVISEIASGAVGRVFLAEHTLLGRKVALKMLRSEYSNTPSLVRRFFAEAKMVNEIGHPNIVAITDFVISEEHPIFYVMELLEGCTLQQLLKDQSTIDVRIVVDIAMQLCAALQAAHEKGVVHRDLKPDNIFLLPNEARYDVRLLDFGVAKFVRSHNKNYTSAGALNGTPRYMSPEATFGGEVDHRADLYSLGMVLYEMLAGFHPFEGSLFEEILRDQRSREVAPLREAASRPIPEALAALVHSCLKKDPGDRPRSAAEIRRRLAALIAAPSPRRLPAIALSIALVLMGAAVAGLAIGTTEEPIVAPPEVMPMPMPMPMHMPVQAQPPAAPPAEVKAVKEAPKPKIIRRKKKVKRRATTTRRKTTPLPDGAEVRNPYD